MSYTKTQWNNDTAPAINETNLNKIEQGIYDNDSHIGDLSDLETTANTDLVSAINENVSSIGDLSDLETTTQTDIVSAINEVNAKSEIDNTYGTSQTRGYSQEYQNAHNVVVSATEPTNKSKVWLQSNGNIFDGVLELGTITSNGTNADNNDRRRSKNYIKVKPSTTYTLRFNGQADTIVFEYNSSRTFIQQISSTWTSQPYTFTTSANTEYIRFISYDTTTTKALLKAGNQAPADEIDITDKTYILDDDNMYREFTPQNDVYSSTEQVIGTWIDGKPIYRFVAKGNFSNHTAGTGFYETHPNVVANVDTFISINAIRNNNRSILYMKNFSNDYWLSTYFEQNGFTFSGNMGLTTSDYYVVTLEYTKTTDA